MPESLPYKIHVDTERLFVEVRVPRILTPEEAAWLGEDTRAAIRQLGSRVGQHVTLYDASAVPVLPPATVDIIAAQFRHPEVLPFHARRVAFLVGSPLMRRQVGRVMDTHPAMAVFDDRAAARDWLGVG